jgi:MFS family permease
VTITRGNGLLRQRDFRLLWFGETVSKCGSAATTVALPLIAVANLHASTFMVGVLEACTWLPWLLVSLPAGAWVDRFVRRRVMQTCNILSAMLFVSVPAAWWYGHLGIEQLLAVAFCAGTAKVFFRTAFQAYLPTVVAPDRLAAGNAMIHGSAATAEVAGPGIAGAMAQVFGAVMAVLVDAISFLISALCLSGIQARERRTEDPRRTAGLAHQIAVGLRYVARDPFLRTLTLFGALGNLVLVAIQTLQVVFLVRVVGVTPGLAGLLMAGMGVGGLVGAVSVRPIIDRLGTARTMLWCQLYTAPFGLLLPVTDSGVRLVLFALGNAVLATGIVAGSVVTATFRQSYCPPYLLGRVSSVMSFLVIGVMPVGALIGGAAGSVLGVREAMWILAGALMLPVMVLVFSPISRLRDLPTRREVDVERVPP